MGSGGDSRSGSDNGSGYDGGGFDGGSYDGGGSDDDSSDWCLGYWGGEDVDEGSDGHDVCKGNNGDSYAGWRVMKE